VRLAQKTAVAPTFGTSCANLAEELWVLSAENFQTFPMVFDVGLPVRVPPERPDVTIPTAAAGNKDFRALRDGAPEFLA